jgi:hypothetical protein
MDDPRVKLLLLRAKAHPIEAARLEAEADVVMAARAQGVSLWGSEMPPPFLQKVLVLVQWDPAVCGVMRAVCSTWGSIVDALLPRLYPRRSLEVMAGKMRLFESVAEGDLTGCEGGVCGDLVELQSMPSLRSLVLPASCAERAVDAEVVHGLTTLTTLRFCELRDVDEDGDIVEEVGEWVLDLSRLPTLLNLNLNCCPAVTDKEVLELSNLTGLMDLNLAYCVNITSEGLRTLSSLTALKTLDLYGCVNITSEGLRAVIK